MSGLALVDKINYLVIVVLAALDTGGAVIVSQYLCKKTKIWQIAANGVAFSIDQIALIVVNANNLAMITVIGHCMGARGSESSAKYTKKLMKISYIPTALLVILVCLLLPVSRLRLICQAACVLPEIRNIPCTVG